MQHDQDAAQGFAVVQPLAVGMIHTTGRDGSGGSLRAHRSSDTVHSGYFPFLTRQPTTPMTNLFQDPFCCELLIPIVR